MFYDIDIIIRYALYDILYNKYYSTYKFNIILVPSFTIIIQEFKGPAQYVLR